MVTPEKIISVLKEKKMKLTLAESCTGGMISALLTAVPGCSEVYGGGICSYSDEVKNQLLGVGNETLTKLGAVSARSASEMAKGALILFGADVSLSVTGFAGPDGGTEKNPVGTVFVACATQEDLILRRFLFKGNRAEVRKKASVRALQILEEMLEKN